MGMGQTNKGEGNPKIYRILQLLLKIHRRIQPQSKTHIPVNKKGQKMGMGKKGRRSIQRKYYWPHMRDLIKKYVKNCDTCQRTKAVRHAPYGLLQPNEVPEKPWKSISMDFITDLPKSEGYDPILVVIDRLTKMSHFIPCYKDMNAGQFAKSFIKEIFRLHGLPNDIITDRGTIFTSDLWKETTKLLGIERRLCTAFHPQTDGQTERTNATLEQYLRAYSNYQQDNWSELLSTAEFAYNNGDQETIKHTPFFANYGMNPEYEAIGHLMQGNITPLEEMSQLHHVLRAEMSEAQIRQKNITINTENPIQISNQEIWYGS